jgi:LPXTG-motif cell wall-anchored protein
MNSLINWRTVVTALCGVGLAAGVFTFRAQADQWDKRTILTVDQPIQVEETLLPAGKYVFKLLNSNSDRHVVQIYNGDQSRIINTVLAIPNYQLEPKGESRFTFWETPPGNAKALRAWFYPGDNFGQEFRYPKHLTVLEASAATTTIARPEPTPEPTPAPVTTEAAPPPTEPAPTPIETAPTPEPDRPVETAQAAPPPPQAVPPPAEPPTRLPKTGSWYPLAGLAGLFSLGLFGLLRVKQTF